MKIGEAVSALAEFKPAKGRGSIDIATPDLFACVFHDQGQVRQLCVIARRGLGAAVAFARRYQAIAPEVTITGRQNNGIVIRLVNGGLTTRRNNKPLPLP
jgi:hypothetical protein